MNDSVARTLIQILSSSITSLLMFLLFYKLYKPKYHNKTVYIITFFFFNYMYCSSESIFYKNEYSIL